MHRHADEIRATDLPDGGVRIDLPDRKGGPESCGGVPIGLFVMVCGIILAVRSVASPDQSGALLVAVVGAVAVLIGLLILRGGAFGLIGFRRAIEVGQRRLRVVERLGPLWRSRSRALHAVRGLLIRPEQSSARNVRSTAPAFCLDAECTSRALRLADRCPRALAARVAERVARACRDALAVSGREAPPLPIRQAGPPELESAAVKPADAEVTANARGGGLRLVVPPLGFRRAPKGPFILGLAFLAFSTVASLSALGVRAAPPDLWALIFFSAVMLVFWGVGLFALAQALRVAYSETLLSVRGGFLALTREDLFGTVRRRWRRAEIKGIEIGPCAALPKEKGRPPIPEVQVHFKAGGSFGVLAGRDERELRWVADALRKALSETPRKEPRATPDLPKRPAGSRAVLEQTADGFTLKIPALGFRGKALWVLACSSFAGVAASGGAAAAVWNGATQAWSIPLWAGVIVLTAVAVLGFAVALEAVAFARCRRILSAEGDVLTLWQTTWWGGLRKEHWRRSELTAVDVGPPNRTGGPLALPHLQLRPHGRKVKGLLTYHDEEELLWIAALIRRALRLDTPDEA